MTKTRNIPTFVDVFRWTVRTGVRVSPPPLNGSYLYGPFSLLSNKQGILYILEFMNKYLKIKIKLNYMRVIEVEMNNFTNILNIYTKSY